MAANIIWKPTNAIVGIVPVVDSGVIPFRPKKSSPPITPPIEGPKASEYPHNTQIRLTRASVKNECISVESTFFFWTSPP